MKHNNHYQKGQTIVEVLIALATGVIIVSAMTIVVLNSLNSAQFSTNENLANKFTQEGMEYITSLQKEDPTTFQLLAGTYCFAGQDDKTKDPGCQEICTTEPCTNKACRAYTNIADCTPFSSSNTTFRRTVSVEKSSSSCGIKLQDGTILSNLTKVNIGVQWADSKCPATNPYCHNASVVSCF